MMLQRQEMPIQVFSEISRLKRVILHRPGKELENLIPMNLERLLFDDIPYLEAAQAEHDAFARVLNENDVEVLYLEQLVAQAIDDAQVKEAFIDEWLSESGLEPGSHYAKVKEYLMAYEDTFEMVLKTMAGFTKAEIKVPHGNTLLDNINKDYPLLIDPMPSLYFTRDPFATIGNGVALNYMYSETRNRETIYGKYLFEHHPAFNNQKVPLYYFRNESTYIEGGDILVLSKDVLGIGISQRTDARSIEKIARNVFKDTSYQQVLAFMIGSNRKFMHLDTVFTMIDHDKFLIHPEIEDYLKVFAITEDGRGGIRLEEKMESLEHILEEALKLENVQLIRCGGDDPVVSAREQWNDGANALALAPGELIVYDRNIVTNQLLEDAGIKLHKIKGSELVRGRGGPRCMSMPIYRER
ncbi:arginine deiminase [Fundicoccus culcitae]|uniref:Arginine deiminase n=1 Tax=Fundicoccus culcitae TaxID=2969821 RepID=A0ABY5P2G6_9LACT|nr:arginine deiminase [Fundicoccus culcitae]UUX32904.1 arginine deiminase [Fundicoccus culcitae]